VTPISQPVLKGAERFFWRRQLPKSVIRSFQRPCSKILNASSRPYVNSPLTIQEITGTGCGIPDPGGLPGALRYDGLGR